MGRVFEAVAPTGERVAVKVMKSTDPAFLARFEREKRLLAELGDEEGFVPLLDSGTSPGGPYIVMPLLEGGSLRARLEKGPLPAREVLELGLELAQALGRAHERGIVHRDLKPENVIFSGSERPGSRPARPLIADLGLAKHFAGAGNLSLTDRSTAGGTFGYMAPEQLEDMKSVGPAADVFSLGATLYECLAGTAPFGKGVLTYVDGIKSGPPRPLHELGVAAPAGLEAAIRRALQADPERRPADGHAFARVLRGEKTRARSRLPVAIALGAALAVALVALAWPPRAAPPAAAGPPRAPVVHEVPPVTARPDPAKARALCNEGAAHKEAGRYDEAIAAETRAIELDPSLAPAWLNRGAARLQEGDADGAIVDESRAVELDPGLAGAWLMRGRARLSRNDLPGAITDLTRAVEVDPKLRDAWLDLGVARMNGADYSGAIEDETRAIQLDPMLASAWSNRGAARIGAGDPAVAVADLTRAIEIDPRAAAAWMRRGEARFMQRELDGAIADETKAVELDPRLAQAWVFRGDVRLVAGDRAGAAADYEQALQAQPGYTLSDEARTLVAERRQGGR